MPQQLARLRLQWFPTQNGFDTLQTSSNTLFLSASRYYFSGLENGHQILKDSVNLWQRVGEFLPYFALRGIESSICISKKSKIGQNTERELGDNVWKNLFQGKLTYLHWNKGEEMAPTIGGKGETLLVRKLPSADAAIVFVGDVVVLKDPEIPDNHLVRRLAAIEGCEMVSTDEKDEPFVLEDDQCWVLSDNETLKATEAKDSRTFGPVCMTDIVGRVIYSLRTAVDHGAIQNSRSGMKMDSSVLEVELDVNDMAKSTKA